ncbi:MAG: hypothetical protein ACI85F_001796, partial [Bacteroidia bacterium]
MKYLIPLSFLFAVLMISSCDQIPCNDVECGDYGTCDESTELCNCDPGYGPENLSPCEAYNLKFESDWTGSHVDQNSTSTGPYT